MAVRLQGPLDFGWRKQRPLYTQDLYKKSSAEVLVALDNWSLVKVVVTLIIIIIIMTISFLIICTRHSHKEMYNSIEQ